MRRDKAEQYGIRTAGRPRGPRAGSGPIAGDLQFFGRHEWVEVQKKLRPGGSAEIRPMDPTLMYEAVAQGHGRRRVRLHQRRADRGVRPRRAGGPEARLPAVRRRAAGLAPGGRGRPDLVEALRPLVGAITVERDAHRPTGGSTSTGSPSAAPPESC